MIGSIKQMVFHRQAAAGGRKRCCMQGSNELQQVPQNGAAMLLRLRTCLLHPAAVLALTSKSCSLRCGSTLRSTSAAAKCSATPAAPMLASLQGATSVAVDGKVCGAEAALPPQAT
jgi:hypothetical protein